MEASRTIVQIVHLDEYGDSCYRMRWPAEELARQHTNWRIINVHSNASERFELARHADLLIIYCSHDIELLSVIEERKKKGLKTLVEYNDYFYEPPAASPVRKDWSSPFLWRDYEQFMKSADAVIVTGEGLRDLLAAHVEQTYIVLKNYLPRNVKKFKDVWSNPQDTIHIGWAGSQGHIADLLAFMPYIEELLEMYPNVHFNCMGNRAIPRLMRLPSDRYSYVPWSSMEDYYNFWKGIHIGVAPLLDTPYNRGRSDVKALEMSAMGVVPLLSVLTPYEDFISKTNCPSGFSMLDLGKRLELLVRQAGALKNIAKVCHTYVSKERVASHSQKRGEIFETYFVDQQIEYTWSQDIGYHEVGGDGSAQSHAALKRQKIEKELSQGSKETALVLCDELLTKQPYDPGVQLYKLRILAGLGKEDIQRDFEHAIQSYPGDLRFALLALQVLDDKQVLGLLWEYVLETLQSLQADQLDFYEAQLIEVYQKRFSNDVVFSKLAIRLLDFYPFAAALLLPAARVSEKNKDDQTAYEFYSRLEHLKRSCGHTDAFLRSLDMGFIV